MNFLNANAPFKGLVSLLRIVYRDDKSKPWQVLDDYTLNALAEFKTCSEAEDYARSHGQSVLIITYNEYHELMD